MLEFLRTFTSFFSRLSNIFQRFLGLSWFLLAAFGKNAFRDLDMCASIDWAYQCSTSGRISCSRSNGVPRSCNECFLGNAKGQPKRESESRFSFPAASFQTCS